MASKVSKVSTTTTFQVFNTNETLLKDNFVTRLFILAKYLRAQRETRS